MALTEPGWEFWLSDERTDEQRADYVVEYVYKPYKVLVDEFHESADTCVERFNDLRHRHERWRHRIIVGTGIVAITNALSALVTGLDPKDFILSVDQRAASVFLAALAAVAAASLAILANLENFGNYLERGHAYRDARELFLDAEREFDRLWQTHVIPFWGRPEACINARELYRRICIKDSELRQKAKDLTQPRSGRAGS